MFLYFKAVSRKLIRIPQRSLEESIRNEVQAVASICKHGGHQIIIPILGHGWLIKCVLHRYGVGVLEPGGIYQRADLLCGVDIEAIPISNPTFVRNDCDPTRQVENMWVIAMHIARGLEFLHSLGHIYRDLKPSNG
jgi:serine/threonine protein kinase